MKILMALLIVSTLTMPTVASAHWGHTRPPCPPVIHPCPPVHHNPPPVTPNPPVTTPPVPSTPTTTIPQASNSLAVPLHSTSIVQLPSSAGLGGLSPSAGGCMEPMTKRDDKDSLKPVQNCKADMYMNVSGISDQTHFE